MDPIQNFLRTLRQSTLRSPSYGGRAPKQKKTDEELMQEGREEAQKEVDEQQKVQAKADKAAADEAKRQQNNIKEAAWRAEGRPMYVDANGVIQPVQPDEIWEQQKQEKVAKLNAAAAEKQQKEALAAQKAADSKHRQQMNAGTAASRAAIGNVDDQIKTSTSEAELTALEKRQAKQRAERQVKELEDRLENDITLTPEQRTNAEQGLAAIKQQAAALQTDLDGAETQVIDRKKQELSWEKERTRMNREVQAFEAGIPLMKAPGDEQAGMPATLSEAGVGARPEVIVPGSPEARTKARERRYVQSVRDIETSPTLTPEQKKAALATVEKRFRDPKGYEQEIVASVQKLSDEELAQMVDSLDYEVSNALAGIQTKGAIVDGLEAQFKARVERLRQAREQVVTSGVSMADSATLTLPDGTTEMWPAKLAETYLSAQRQHALDMQRVGYDDLMQDVEEHNLEASKAQAAQAEMVRRQQIQEQEAEDEKQMAYREMSITGQSGTVAAMQGLEKDLKQRKAAIEAQHAEGTPQRAAALKALQADVKTQEQGIRAKAGKQAEGGAKLYDMYRDTNVSDWKAEKGFVRLQQEAEKLGMTEQDALYWMDYYQQADWNKPRGGAKERKGYQHLGDEIHRGVVAIVEDAPLEEAEQVRVLPDGQVTVNPVFHGDASKYAAAVKAAPASKEAKAAAMEAFPALEEAWGEQHLETLQGEAFVPALNDFEQWRTSKLQTTPDFARKSVASQAVEFLKMTKDRPWYAKLIETGVRRLAQGTGAAIGGVLGAGGLVTGVLPRGLDQGLNLSESLSTAGAAWTATGQKFGQANKLKGNESDLGLKAIGQTVELLPQIATMIAGAGIVGGSMKGVAALSAAQTAGAQYVDTYTTLRKRGASHEEAWAQSAPYAVASGLVTAALTTAGGPRGIEALAVKPSQMKAVMNAAWKQAYPKLAKTLGIGYGAVSEIAEELPDELFSQISEQLATNPGADVSRIVGDFIASSPELMLAIGAMGAGGEIMGGERRAEGGETEKTQPAATAELPSISKTGLKKAAQERLGALREKRDGKWLPDKDGTLQPVTIGAVLSSQEEQTLKVLEQALEGDAEVDVEALSSAFGFQLKDTITVTDKPETVAAAEAAIGAYADPKKSAEAVAVTKARAGALLKISQGATLEDLSEAELNGVGFARDVQTGEMKPGRYTNDPKTGALVWKAGETPPNHRHVYAVQDAKGKPQLVIAQQALDKLRAVMPEVAAAIKLDEAGRVKQVKGADRIDGGLTSLTDEKISPKMDVAGASPDRGASPQVGAVAAQGAAGVTESGPPRAVGTPVGGDSAAPLAGVTGEVLGSQFSVLSLPEEERAEQLAFELSRRGLDEEQAGVAARLVVKRMGVNPEGYAVQMAGTDFDDAMSAMGWVRGKGKKWVLASPERWEAAQGARDGGRGTGDEGRGTRGEPALDSNQLKSQGSTDVPQATPAKEADAIKQEPPAKVGYETGKLTPLEVPELIESKVWREAKIKAIDGFSRGFAKGKAAATATAVKSMQALERLVDQKFGPLFDQIVIGEAQDGGGLGAMMGRDGQTVLVISPAAFIRFGARTDGGLELALSEEVIHAFAQAKLSRAEIVGKVRQMEQHAPEMIRVWWQTYYAPAIQDGNMPATPPAKLSDEEAYHAGHEILRMMVQDAVFAGKVFESLTPGADSVTTETVEALAGIVEWLKQALKTMGQTLKSALGKLEPKERASMQRVIEDIADLYQRAVESGERISDLVYWQKEAARGAEKARIAAEKEAMLKGADSIQWADVVEGEDLADAADAADAYLDAAPKEKETKPKQATGGAIAASNLRQRLAEIPDPDTQKENILVAIARSGKIMRPSKAYIERMKAEGKTVSLADWNWMERTPVPFPFSNLVFRAGNGSTMDRVIPELHSKGFFPGVAVEDVTGDMVAAKILDVIDRYNAKKSGNDQDSQEQRYWDGLEEQALRFERATESGPVDVHAASLQVGDVMMLKGDDGKPHRVEVIKLDLEPATEAELDQHRANVWRDAAGKPVKLASVTLKDGTTFGVQTIDGDERIYVDALTVDTKDLGTATPETGRLGEKSLGARGMQPATHVFPDGYVLTEPGVQMLGARVMAHHGTPHKVDKFSLSKVGTGEGAQAYGWGLYFAESEGVAKSYKEKLTHEKRMDASIGDTRRIEAMNRLYDHGKSKPKPTGPPNAKGWGNLPSYTAAEQAELDQWDAEHDRLTKELTRLEALSLEEAKSRIPGNLYTVELLTDEEEFLDWDKPMSQQGAKVKTRLQALWPEADFDAVGSGADLYRGMSGSKIDASNRLAKLGIPGIRYLDGNSRGKTTTERFVVESEAQARADKLRQQGWKTVSVTARGFDEGDGASGAWYVEGQESGTSNYVIFDEKLVRILKENGQPVEQALGSRAMRGQGSLFGNEDLSMFGAGPLFPGTTQGGKVELFQRQSDNQTRRQGDREPVSPDTAPAFNLESASPEQLRAEATRREQAAKIKDRQSAPLVGTQGDIGQMDMLGGGDLFASPAPRVDTPGQDAPVTAGPLESDRPRGTAADGGREAGVSADAGLFGADAGGVGADGEGSQDTSGNDRAADGSAAPAGRAGGAERVQGEASRVPGSPAGSAEPAGSGGIDDTRAAVESGAELDLPGLAPERPAADEVAEERESTPSQRLIEQATVQNTAEGWDDIVPGDLENIAKTLPILLPQQHDDVRKAENRWFNQQPTKDDPKKGMLFTNGTGTGKTFTGLGIIKRFEMMGRGRVLIVVPTQVKVTDWQTEGLRAMVKATPLNNTTDVGKGVVVTTYANFRDNSALQAEPWDLVVYDESHYLGGNAQGSQTESMGAHYRATNKPGFYAQQKAERAVIGAPPDWADKDAAAAYQAKKLEKAREIDEKRKSFPDTKAVFLSATPFSYHKSLGYADGYLFNSPRSESTGYNVPQGMDRYLVENFGWTMRTNRLTSPPPEVDVGLMEREWSERQFQNGAMSGRMIDVPFDYSREFILLDSDIGRQLDEGFHDLAWGPSGESREESTRWRPLREAFRQYWYGSAGGYSKRMQLLESIKIAAALERMNQHLDLRRKIVLFHSYNNAEPVHPFTLGYLAPMMDAKAQALAAEWRRIHPDLVGLDFKRLFNPRALVADEFGERARFFNGEVQSKDRTAAVKAFNADDGGVDIIMVQMDAGKEGISLHDVTGTGRQRVLMNAALPVKPTDAIQSEGRIYRIGVLSNAIQEYLTLHTMMERSAFGSKISERTGTVENMALGKMARTLKDSFKSVYLNAHSEAPSAEQGLGGKKQDAAELLGSDMDRAKSYYFSRQKKTSRNKAAEGVDYFATPEPVGLTMVRFLDAKAGMDLLEPSAGHGAIGRFFPDFTNNKFVEPSRGLSDELRIKVAAGKVEVMPFEDLHIVNKFDGVAMNPPFGTAGKMALEHVAKAAKHLRQGGRLVALIPEGPAMEKRFEQWLYEGEGKDMHLRASYGLPTVTFERAGTSVKTRIVVLDKADLWELREDEGGAWAAYDSFDQKRTRNFPFEGDARKFVKAMPDFIGFRGEVDLQGRSPRELSAETIGELFDQLENLSPPGRIVRDVATEKVEVPSFAQATEGTAEAKSIPTEREYSPVVTKASNTGFTAALKEKVDIEAAAKAASDALRAFPRGEMGLTPDAVKATPEWRTAKTAYDTAAAKLKTFNQSFLKQWGKEYRQPIQEERAGVPALPSSPYAVAETLHAKKGTMTYVAKMERRLSDTEYRSELSRAKAAGGYYSAFKGSGAIPGFQFPSAAVRDAFVAGYGAGQVLGARAMRGQGSLFGGDDLSMFGAGPLFQGTTMGGKAELYQKPAVSNDTSFNLESASPEQLRAEATKREQAEKIKDRQSAPLVGTQGDIGQMDMLGGGDLFAQPQAVEGVPAVDNGLGQEPLTVEVPKGAHMRKPIKGASGTSIVGYEWRSTQGEKWDNREGGIVPAKVSDWDNADISEGTGRSIVHVFYVQHADGRISKEGIQSAQNLLKRSMSDLRGVAKTEVQLRLNEKQRLKDEMKALDSWATETTPEGAWKQYLRINAQGLEGRKRSGKPALTVTLYTRDGRYVARGGWENEMEQGGWSVVVKRSTDDLLNPPEPRIGDFGEKIGGARKDQEGGKAPKPKAVKTAETEKGMMLFSRAMRGMDSLFGQEDMTLFGAGPLFEGSTQQKAKPKTVSDMTDAELRAVIDAYQSKVAPMEAEQRKLADKVKKAKQKYQSTADEARMSELARDMHLIYVDSGAQKIQQEINRRDGIAMKQRRESADNARQSALQNLEKSDSLPHYPIQDAAVSSHAWWAGVPFSKAPSRWQKRLIDVVDDILPKDGTFMYNRDLDAQVLARMGADFRPEDMDVRKDQVEGGQVGSEIYSARKAVESMREKASRTKQAEALKGAKVFQNVAVQGIRMKTLTLGSEANRDGSLPFEGVDKNDRTYTGWVLPEVVAGWMEAKKPVEDPNQGALFTRPMRSSATSTAPVDQAAHEAATSPNNPLPEPTQAQKEAGNYRLGHTRISGHEISIENPAGSERRGVDPSGKAWSVTMQDHYGYFKGTNAKDGDHVDVFVKAGTPADYAGPVHIVRQVKVGSSKSQVSSSKAGAASLETRNQKPETSAPPKKQFDEYKVMLGYPTAEEARAAYLRNYAKGWQGLDKLTSHTQAEFQVIKDQVFTVPGPVREGDKVLAFQPPAKPDLADALVRRTLPPAEQEKQKKLRANYADAFAAWLESIPANKAIIFKDENVGGYPRYSALTRDTEGGWRTTEYSSVLEMPISHEVFDTRLEAAKTRAAWQRIEKLPFVPKAGEYHSQRTPHLKLTNTDGTSRIVKFGGYMAGGVTAQVIDIAGLYTGAKWEVVPVDNLAPLQGAEKEAAKKQEDAVWKAYDESRLSQRSNTESDSTLSTRPMRSAPEMVADSLDAVGNVIAKTGNAMFVTLPVWTASTAANVGSAVVEKTGVQKPLAWLGSNRLDKWVYENWTDKWLWARARNGKDAVKAWLQKPGALNGVGKAIADNALPLWSVPREWLAMMHESQRKAAWGREKAMDLIRALSHSAKVSDLAYPKEFVENLAYRVQMFDAMEGKIPMTSLPKPLQDLAERLRGMLETTGRELVKQGLMNLDTFEELRDTGWMPRFTEDEAGETAGSWLKAFKLGIKDLKQQRSTAWHIVDTTRKEPDGQYVTVNRTEGAKRNRWRFRDERQRDGFYEDFIRTEAVRFLQEGGKDVTNMLAALKIDDKKSLRDEIGRLTRASIDLPAAMSEPMRNIVRRAVELQRVRYKKEKPFEPDKLIKDPVYAVARYVMAQTHNAATMELMKETAKVKSWVTEVDTAGFTQIPDNPRFGPLAGKFVRDDIATQVLDVVNVDGAALKFYDSMLRKWKGGKLVLNPGSHIRDAVGNTAFAYLGGNSLWNPGNWPHYRDAIATLRDGGAKFAELIEMQVLGGDAYTTQVKTALRGLLPDQKTVENADAGALMRMVMGLGAGARGTYEYLSALRSLPDDFYKTAAYNKYRAQGMDPREAAAEVRKWFPYYDRLGTSKYWKVSGRFLNPFGSFFRESTRIMGRAAMERPMALSAVMLFATAVTRYSLMALGLGDDDEEAVFRAMRGKLKGGVMDAPVFSMLLPMRTSEGQLQQWDLSSVMPFADLIGTRVEAKEGEDEFTKFWRGLFTASPILAAAWSASTNTDAFTGRKIVQDDMGVIESTGERLKNLAGDLLPPLTPGVGVHAATLSNAGRRTGSLEMRNKYQSWIRALVGMDVRSADPDLRKETAFFRQQNNLPVEGNTNSYTTPLKSRLAADIRGELIQDEPALDKIAEAMARLEASGNPIRTPKQMTDLLDSLDPTKLIKKEFRTRLIASFSPEARRVFDNRQTEFKKSQAKAPGIMAEIRRQQAKGKE